MFRSHYEVTLQQGRNTWSVGTGGRVVFGQPVEQALGPYRLVLTAQRTAPERYTLKVAVGVAPTHPGGLYVPSVRSFSGNLGAPLEFQATLGGGLVLKGAIMLAPVPPRS